MVIGLLHNGRRLYRMTTYFMQRSWNPVEDGAQRRRWKQDHTMKGSILIFFMQNSRWFDEDEDLLFTLYYSVTPHAGLHETIKMISDPSLDMPGLPQTRFSISIQHFIVWSFHYCWRCGKTFFGTVSAKEGSSASGDLFYTDPIKKKTCHCKLSFDGAITDVYHGTCFVLTPMSQNHPIFIECTCT